MRDLGIEEVRLTSIIKLHGIDEAVNFAKRTLSIYRKAVLDKRKPDKKKWHHASLPQFRRGFIESYLIFKRFIHDFEKKYE